MNRIPVAQARKPKFISLAHRWHMAIATIVGDGDRWMQGFLAIALAEKMASSGFRKRTLSQKKKKNCEE